MGDKKIKKEGKKASTASKEKTAKKKERREQSKVAASTFSTSTKRVLNHKKAHGRHSKNGDK